MAEKKDEYRMEPHQYVFWKSIGKHYCVKCGLVSLGNDFSKWANDKGCMNADHTSYDAVRRKFTKKFNF